MEKEIVVIPYAVIQICDSCQRGEMLPTGQVDYSFPFWCEHECGNCGIKKNFSDKYPIIKFQREA